MSNAGPVIGKVLRGNGAAGLLRYLFGPGRAHEHTDPHVVARWDDVGALLPADPRPDQSARRRLARLLEQPLAVLTKQPASTVWHCSLRAAPSDRRLTDAEWADVAREVLDRTGLAPKDDDASCRWAAVRHADDHIHLVVTLARQDGHAARTSNDFYRVGEACRWAEQTYGLQTTAARDRTAARRPSRGEQEKASRNARPESPRTTLQRTVRRAAAASASKPEFLDHLRSSGLLVRERSSTVRPDEVTGYAVALPGDRTAAGDPVWFGGGKLAPDLTLPRLLAAWGESVPAAPPRTSAARQATWATAVRAAHAGALEVRRLADVSPGAAADAAHATAGTLTVLAHAVEGRRGGPLTDAADAYDRASRELWARPIRRTTSGTHLRRAVRQLHRLGRAGHDETAQVIALVAELVALVEQVARLREVQQRAAQAAAARAAAERLRGVQPRSADVVRHHARRPQHAHLLEGIRR